MPTATTRSAAAPDLAARRTRVDVLPYEHRIARMRITCQTQPRPAQEGIRPRTLTANLKREICSERVRQRHHLRSPLAIVLDVDVWTIPRTRPYLGGDFVLGSIDGGAKFGRFGRNATGNSESRPIRPHVNRPSEDPTPTCGRSGAEGN